MRNEIAEQLENTPVDWVCVSVGDGCTLAGIWKGLKAMHSLGILTRLPKMLGVQSAQADPVVKAYQANATKVSPSEAWSLADSINVGKPANDVKVLQAIKDSGGSMISVDDSEILEALKTTPKLSGILGEPAATASIAGLRKAASQNLITSTDSCLAVITGHGLNDLNSLKSVTGNAHILYPDIQDLEAIYQDKPKTFSK